MLVTEVGAENAGALSGERLGGGRTDAVVGARDQSNPSVRHGCAPVPICSAQGGEAVERRLRLRHEAAHEVARGDEFGDGAHALAGGIALPVDVHASLNESPPRCMAPAP